MQDAFYDEEPKGVGFWLTALYKWAAAAVSLALVVAILVWAYNLGVRDARDIPVIRAQEGPVREQPADPGGTEVAHQGLEVNEILGGGTASIPETARVETPDISLTDEDRPVAREQSDTAALAGPLGAPELAPLPAPQAAPEAQGNDDLPEVLSVRPRPRPEGLRIAVARPEPAPAAEETPAEVPAPQAAAPAPRAAEPEDITPGTRLVQLGAFVSNDQAMRQWQRLVGAHSDLLGTKQRYVQAAESNGRTFYRLRVIGFDTSNDQRAICEALRARSVDCIPVTVR